MGSLVTQNHQNAKKKIPISQLHCRLIQDSFRDPCGDPRGDPRGGILSGILLFFRSWEVVEMVVALRTILKMFWGSLWGILYGISVEVLYRILPNSFLFLFHSHFRDLRDPFQDTRRPRWDPFPSLFQNHFQDPCRISAGSFRIPFGVLWNNWTIQSNPVERLQNCSNVTFQTHFWRSSWDSHRDYFQGSWWEGGRGDLIV